MEDLGPRDPQMARQYGAPRTAECSLCGRVVPTYGAGTEAAPIRACVRCIADATSLPPPDGPDEACEGK